MYCILSEDDMFKLLQNTETNHNPLRKHFLNKFLFNLISIYIHIIDMGILISLCRRYSKSYTELDNGHQETKTHENTSLGVPTNNDDFDGGFEFDFSDDLDVGDEELSKYLKSIDIV